MKFTTSIMLLLASALLASAQLTRNVSVQLLTGGTNVLANLSTNIFVDPLVADISNQEKVAIQVHGGVLSSNWLSLRLDFMQSVEGTVWQSTNWLQVHVQASTNNLSAGQFCTVTNLDVTGLRSLKLFRIANTDYYGIATNLTVTYAIKR